MFIVTVFSENKMDAPTDSAPVTLKMCSKGEWKIVEVSQSKEARAIIIFLHFLHGETIYNYSYITIKKSDIC